MAASTLAVWGGWVLRSARLGNNPFYANPIRFGQLEVAHPFYDYGLGRYIRDYLVSLFGGTWVSFWGDFGWIEAPLDSGYYLMLYAVAALGGAGVLIYFVRAYRRPTPARNPREAVDPRPRFWVRFGQQAGLVAFLGLCAAALTGTLGATNYYSWRSRGVGGGIQGRYYLGAIVPFVVLIALGLLEWIPHKWRGWGHLILRWGMMALQWISLLQVVIPRYYL
jgi:hypothetical protein